MARPTKHPVVYVSLRDGQTTHLAGHLTLRCLTAAQGMALLRGADEAAMARRLVAKAKRKAKRGTAKVPKSRLGSVLEVDP